MHLCTQSFDKAQQLEVKCFLKVYFVCLILYVPVNNFSVMSDGSSWVEPVLSQDKCLLLKDITQ